VLTESSTPFARKEKVMSQQLVVRVSVRSQEEADKFARAIHIALYTAIGEDAFATTLTNCKNHTQVPYSDDLHEYRGGGIDFELETDPG
jgi:hypothetical protein